MENNIKLESLALTNFATFKAESVRFENGLNSIVGETGSGKSLILDALQFILGQRADKKIIRKGAEFASLEAIFSVHSPQVKDYFMEIGFPFEDDQVVIKRIIQTSGKSKVFLNHQVSTIKAIQDFSNQFIDFVGQFSNQKLLDEKHQLEILDSFADISNLRRDYQMTFNQLCRLKSELKRSQESETERLRKIDYLQFQIQEIEELSPSIEEEKQLMEQKSFLQNFEKKQQINQKITRLVEGDNGLLDSIRKIKAATLEETSLFPEDKLNFIEDALENFSSFSIDLSTESTMDFDADELEQLLDKLDRYQKLKRKLGPEIEDVLENFNNFSTELSELENTQDQLNDLETSISALQEKAWKQAQSLHNERKNASKIFSKELVKRLKKLNMPEVKINLELIQNDVLTLSGFNQLQFKIETNPGEGFFLLQDVASGGELSRILLAIREIHASHNNNISIFLFDEIDTGIGGTTALAMGEVLKDISRDSQVIAITHLPQIAQFSDFLIEVSKKTQGSKDKRTESFIKEHGSKQIAKFAKSMTPLNS